ncbi:MAG: hypothetical protein J6T60_06890 [Bacteroidales bacterium]|nr:hypothetical protein [Bacteroidales bacterium]
MDKFEEINYKKNFCEKYFDKGAWDLDVLNQVDVLLKDRKGNSLLYIEAKYLINNEAMHRQALAQAVLTNKKQDAILSQIALIYQDSQKNDILELIDCSDNSVMYNNDINWKAEKPSSPTKDAVDRINDRLKNKITVFQNNEIKEYYRLLKSNQETVISITENNFNVVYNQWKNEIKFIELILDEQELINLFLADILNNTKYKRAIFAGNEPNNLFSTNENDGIEQDLIREGTNLSNYQLMFADGEIDGIKCQGFPRSNYFTVKDKEKYIAFWRKYKRPPEKNEFLKILERSSILYSDRYRRDTGGEYTPNCFVEKQNEILAQHYNLDEFIVFDPCAGVGNLENQFGKDYKRFCYLSTLERMDVDTCEIKGFDNAIQFDYLKDDSQPKFKYKGSLFDINEICKRENRKLMVIMNPPYQRRKDFKYDLAIEFFRKVAHLNPDVIVYYTKTEFFLRDTISVYAESGYKIASHIFSNAKDTFKLSEWSVSQVIFDKENGEKISKDLVKADRYEYDEKNDKLHFIKTYTYDNKRPYLIKEIEKQIWKANDGLILGQWSYLSNVIVVSNGGKEKNNKITSNNLKWCLLSKGINFNSHAKYFEWNYLTYKGVVDDIKEELFNDSIMFSLFYKNNMFSNKGQKNYIMPFTADELGCGVNELNVMFPQDNPNLFVGEEAPQPFDFRVFLSNLEFSAEAKKIYDAALQIFRYYHSNDYEDKDWNDSFYDITNAIMGKDVASFSELKTENDTRISRTKTTKGTKGFGRNTIKYAVSSDAFSIFDDFFNARDILAKKINRQLLEAGLLLWERENIY